MATPEPEKEGSVTAVKNIVKEKTDYALVLVYAIKKDSTDQNLKDLASFVEEVYWGDVDSTFIRNGQTLGESDELHGKRMTYARRFYEKWHEERKEEKQQAELERKLMAGTAKLAEAYKRHSKKADEDRPAEKRKRVDDICALVKDLDGVAEERAGVAEERAGIEKKRKKAE